MKVELGKRNITYRSRGCLLRPPQKLITKTITCQVPSTSFCALSIIIMHAEIRKGSLTAHLLLSLLCRWGILQFPMVHSQMYLFRALLSLTALSNWQHWS